MAATQRAEQRVALLVEENLKLASRVQQLEASSLAATTHRSERGILEHTTMLESSTAGVQLAVENVKLAELHAAAVARADAAQEHVQRLVSLSKRKDSNLAALQARCDEQTREHDETKALVSELYADRERLVAELEVAQREARSSQEREAQLSQSLHQALHAAATATSRGTEAAGEAIALRRQAGEAQEQLEDSERRLEDVAAQLAALREAHDNTVRMYQAQVYDLTRRVHVQESASAAFASSMTGAAGVRGGQAQQQQQLQQLGRSSTGADVASRELMAALGVAMPAASPSAAAAGRRPPHRTPGRSGVDLSPFGDSEESIELAGSKAATQRLQSELAAVQQRSRQRETEARAESTRLRERLDAVEAELESLRASAERHERTAEAAVAEAESLAQALASKEQLAVTAERRAESLSRHAAELAEQLLAAQRAAAAAQAERDAVAAKRESDRKSLKNIQRDHDDSASLLVATQTELHEVRHQLMSAREEAVDARTQSLQLAEALQQQARERIISDALAAVEATSAGAPTTDPNPTQHTRADFDRQLLLGQSSVRYPSAAQHSGGAPEQEQSRHMYDGGSRSPVPQLPLADTVTAAAAHRADENFSESAVFQRNAWEGSATVSRAPTLLMSTRGGLPAQASVRREGSSDGASTTTRGRSAVSPTRSFQASVSTVLSPRQPPAATLPSSPSSRSHLFPRSSTGRLPSPPQQQSRPASASPPTPSLRSPTAATRRRTLGGGEIVVAAAAPPGDRWGASQRSATDSSSYAEDGVSGELAELRRQLSDARFAVVRAETEKRMMRLESKAAVSEAKEAQRYGRTASTPARSARGSSSDLPSARGLQSSLSSHRLQQTRESRDKSAAALSPAVSSVQPAPGSSPLRSSSFRAALAPRQEQAPPAYAAPDRQLSDIIEARSETSRTAYSTITEVVNVDTSKSDFDVMAAHPPSMHVSRGGGGEEPRTAAAAAAAAAPRLAAASSTGTTAASSRSLTLEELATAEERGPEGGGAAAGGQTDAPWLLQGEPTTLRAAAVPAGGPQAASPGDVASMVRRLRSELDVAKRQLAAAGPGPEPAGTR